MSRQERQRPASAAAGSVPQSPPQQKRRWKLDKHGLFQGYLPGSSFGDPRTRLELAPRQCTAEPAHDREVRLLMERAIAPKKGQGGQLASASFYVKPTRSELSRPKPIARNINWFTQKAQSLSRQGRHRSSIAAYRGVLEQHPQHLRSLFNCGANHEELGEYSKAEDCYSKVLLSGKGGEVVDSYALFNKALSLHRRGKLTEALSDYTAAIALNQCVPEFYLNRSLCARSLGDFKLAAQDLKINHSRTRVQSLMSNTLQKLSLGFGSSLPASIKAKAVAWLQRARAAIQLKVVLTARKPFHERTDQDKQLLYRSFCWLEPVKRLELMQQGAEEQYDQRPPWEQDRQESELESQSTSTPAPSRAVALCARMMLRRFAQGERLSETGKPITELMVVLTGHAAVRGADVVPGTAGSEVTAGSVVNGHVFEYMNAEAECTVVASTDMKVVAISRADYDTVLAGATQTDIAARAAFLGSCALFLHLPPEELEALAELMVHQVYSYGQLILDQDHEVPGLYMVLSGIVKLHKQFDIERTRFSRRSQTWLETGERDNGSMSLGTIYAKSFFGEVSMTTTVGVGKATYSVRAHANSVEVLLLPRGYKSMLDDKCLDYIKVLKTADPNEAQIRQHREYEQYWNKYKQEAVFLNSTQDGVKGMPSGKKTPKAQWK